MEYNKLLERFYEIYKGENNARIFVAPGRANLIGEHTDNYGGHVFPCALQLRSACVIRKRNDNIINLCSTSYPEKVTADINKLEQYKSLEWGSYQLGVIYYMIKSGMNVCGADMLFDETVPHGGGLSASAAIEVATGLAISALANNEKEIDMIKLALIGQKTENEYIGMKCGIMDQFTSAMGKKNHGILLRCSDLEYEYIPIDLKKHGLSMVITNTCKPHALKDSEYNKRKHEADSALKDIKKALPHLEYIANLSSDELMQVLYAIKDKNSKKRAIHIVNENERTIKAALALKDDDMVTFGKLITESNNSLRDYYEVTGNELDALHESSIIQKGVLGTRMMGGGFGGCSISIVQDKYVDTFRNNVTELYTKKTGLIPKFYIGEVAQGAREVII